MSNAALTMEGVSKKFRRGELYDSLRDLIPALSGRMFRGLKNQTLNEKEFWALREVSFEVRHGEALGIIGSNGAGKSTILKILSGIMKPTNGMISVNGKLSALIEVSAGFHPDLTGRENIYLNGAILGMSRQNIRAKFDEIVEFSGLESFIDTPVKRYSSGMFARLGFSVAAHVDPDVLIVDEVLSVGDYIFQKKCVERMAEIITGGATVIFVSHNLRAVAELCDQCLLLDHGKVVRKGDTDSVIQHYLSGLQTDRAAEQIRETAISRVGLRDESGNSVRFISGQEMEVDVEISTSVPREKLAVVLDVKDGTLAEIFSTSSQRLGAAPIDLNAGERFNCTFTLDLHLGPGTYHICLFLHRYDIEVEYDHWECAATFFVSVENDIRGVVNLSPRVFYHERQSNIVDSTHK